MKKLVVLILFASQFAYSQNKITLEEIWGKYSFYPKTAKGFNVLKDGKTYVDIDHTTDGIPVIGKFDLKSGDRVGDFILASDLKIDGREIDINTYELSPNEDKL